MDERDALDRLRAADPAAGADGTWADSAARAIAHRRLADQDVVSIGDGPGPRRRSFVWPSVAAAAVLVAAVGLAAVEVRDGDTTPVADGTSTSVPTDPVPTGDPTTTTPSSQDPTPGPTPTGDPKAQTQALIASLLDTVPVVPDATQVDSSPSPWLDTPQSTPASPNLLGVHRFWTVPGTLLDASLYLSTHRPHQYSDGGTMSSDGPNYHVEALSWNAQGTSYATFTEIQIAMIQIGDRVAIRADAQGIWLPPRDPALLLGDVTSVDVTITRYNDGNDGPIPGAPTVTRTLTGADAQGLATTVDELDPDVTGLRSCPMQLSHFDDRFHFVTTAGGTADLTVTVTGCGEATLSVPGHDDLVLVPGGLNAKVLQLLGLPNDYGYH